MNISIHALLAESDNSAYGALDGASISIHALLAESDGGSGVGSWPRVIFLSTLSLRRATVHYDNYNLHCTISIHALLAESDMSTLESYSIIGISIHALLAESDAVTTLEGGSDKDFYPRSPCGERHDLEPSTTRKLTFLSTLSLRRAT